MCSWLFTEHGFYSAVCARQVDGRKREQVDVDRIKVRARIREHLHALIARFPELLGDSTIREFLGADYKHALHDVWEVMYRAQR